VYNSRHTVRVTQKSQDGNAASEHGARVRDSVRAPDPAEQQRRPNQRERERRGRSHPVGTGRGERPGVLRRDQLIDPEIPLQGVFGKGEQSDRRDDGREQQPETRGPAATAGSRKQRARRAAARERDGGVGLDGRPWQEKPSQRGVFEQPAPEDGQTYGRRRQAEGDGDRLPAEARLHMASIPALYR
jgi:hypothetical protein